LLDKNVIFKVVKPLG